jgi:hypothetical protein
MLNCAPDRPTRMHVLRLQHQGLGTGVPLGLKKVERYAAPCGLGGQVRI